MIIVEGYSRPRRQQSLVFVNFNFGVENQHIQVATLAIGSHSC